MNNNEYDEEVDGMSEDGEDLGCGSGCSSCAGCGGGGGEAFVFTQPPRDVTVEYLYLDLETCERCIDTKDILDEVIHEISPVLEMTGIRLTYISVNIANRKLAEEYRFRTSPTILVNGRDIEEKFTENHCSACGDICGDSVDCRSWEIDGMTYDVLPKPVLTNRILEMIFGANTASGDNQPCCGGSKEYVLPDNLARFFEGKKG
ncbi:MAG: DUF2703 domain-containing protein [Saccharofermentanales bacterium]